RCAKATTAQSPPLRELLPPPMAIRSSPASGLGRLRAVPERRRCRVVSASGLFRDTGAADGAFWLELDSIPAPSSAPPPKYRKSLRPQTAAGLGAFRRAPLRTPRCLLACRPSCRVPAPATCTPPSP